MKTYNSQTSNRGKTIILESVEQAIDFGKIGLEKWKVENPDTGNNTWFNHESFTQDFNKCVEAITKGDNEFKKKVEQEVEELLDLIDAIIPSFSNNRSGFELKEEGFTISPEAAFAGEENCMFTPKKDEVKPLKKGSGDGAYRIIINTDVSWWGNPVDNCALVAALIIIMQRFATVEVWIQQGWIGSKEGDGVTLFRLDFSAGFDITNLAFWITHPGKDSPFSYLVNRGLGRTSNATSCVAEIESDIMFRGDWQRMYGFTSSYLANKMYTERIDIVSQWVAATAYKILYDEDAPFTIKLDENGEPI